MADDNGGANMTAGELIKLLPAIILLIVLVAFAFGNTQKTKVDYLFGDVNAPLYIVLLITALVGALIAALIRFRRR